MSLPAVTSDAFRRAMGCFVTGVTVVTTIVDGRPYGLTVNALCAISLDPPLLSISLQRTSRTLAMVERSGCFAVNVLSTAQRELAERFARKDLEIKPFDTIPRHLGAQVRDVVLFDQALACVECVVAGAYPVGDHVVVLGEVMAIEQEGDTRASTPLLFYRSAFHTMRPETVTHGSLSCDESHRHSARERAE